MHVENVRIIFKSEQNCTAWIIWALLRLPAIGMAMAMEDGEMDMAVDTNIDWVTIDPNGLTPKQRRAWQAYQEAQLKAKEQRDALETVLQEGLPKGKALKVNLRFGKLAVALTDASRRLTKADTKAMSLAEYLEQHE